MDPTLNNRYSGVEQSMMMSCTSPSRHCGIGHHFEDTPRIMAPSGHTHHPPILPYAGIFDVGDTGAAGGCATCGPAALAGSTPKSNTSLVSILLVNHQPPIRCSNEGRCVSKRRATIEAHPCSRILAILAACSSCGDPATPIPIPGGMAPSSPPPSAPNIAMNWAPPSWSLPGTPPIPALCSGDAATAAAWLGAAPSAAGRGGIPSASTGTTVTILTKSNDDQMDPVQGHAVAATATTPTAHTLCDAVTNRTQPDTIVHYRTSQCKKRSEALFYTTRRQGRRLSTHIPSCAFCYRRSVISQTHYACNLKDAWGVFVSGAKNVRKRGNDMILYE